MLKEADPENCISGAPSAQGCSWVWPVGGAKRRQEKRKRKAWVYLRPPRVRCRITSAIPLLNHSSFLGALPGLWEHSVLPWPLGLRVVMASNIPAPRYLSPSFVSLALTTHPEMVSPLKSLFRPYEVSLFSYQTQLILLP